MRTSIPFLAALTGVLFVVPAAVRGAEPPDPDLYENLDHLKVGRQLSTAEMRTGIEAALKIPDWKPSDRSKGANNWTPAGGTITSPDPGFERDAIGRIRSAAWSWHNGLAEETLWIGASSGGLYFLGRNPIVPIIRMWVPVSKNLPGSHSVGAFLVRPGNSDIILIGTGDPGRWEGGTGLYRTTDGGTTWTHIDMSPEPSEFYGLVSFADAPDAVLAATSLGLYISFNFGEVWNRLGYFSGEKVTDIARATADSDWILGVAGQGVYRCSSLGLINHCTAATGIGGTIGRVSVAASASNPSYVFALVSDGYGYNGVYRSSDGGSTFVNIDDHFTGTDDDPLAWDQGWHTGAIAVDPANPDRVMVGMAAAQITFNATATDPNDVCWRRNSTMGPFGACDTNGLDAGHVDQTSMAFLPQSVEPGNTKILITNDGGIFLYDWSANTIDDSYNEIGLNVSQVTLPMTFDRSLSNPDRLLAGLQDNGVVRINLDGVPAAYEGLRGGDGGQVSIHPNNDGDFVFVSGAAYNRFRWIGAGPEEGMNVNLPGYGGLDMSMVYNHDLSAAVVFTHDERYLYYRWVWEDHTVNWKYANPYHPLPSGVFINRVETGSDNTLTVYVTDANSAANGTAALYILTGTLGDMDWVDGTPSGAMVFDEPAGGRVFTDRSDTNGDHVYFTTGPNRPSRAYLSTNRGGTWWQVSGDLESTLSGVDFWQLLSHPYNHTILFLATEVGIFRSDNGGQHWYRYMDNLPAVVKVRAMQIHSNGPDDTDLVIGTWGHGMWQREVEFNDHIFGDGFEIGSTTHWDVTVGD